MTYCKLQRAWLFVKMNHIGDIQSSLSIFCNAISTSLFPSDLADGPLQVRRLNTEHSCETLARDDVECVGQVLLNHHLRGSNSFMLNPFKTNTQVSQSASTTLPYLASNGLHVAVVRSMSWLAACSSFKTTWTHTSSSVSGIWPNRP